MSITETQFDFTRIDRRTRKVTPALIAAIRDRIVTHLHPDKIILFGSRASDTAMPESDIDLLVILSDDHPLARVKRRDRFGALLNLFRYRSFGLDAFVFTDAEVQKIKDENEGEWDLILEILAQGVLLYDRAAKTEAQ
jgi:predicted nucleotidyltransferase